jgi:hypothetical protein
MCKKPMLNRAWLAAALILSSAMPSSAELVVHSQRVRANGADRIASFSGQVDVGACRMLQAARVTMRPDGTVSWSATVAATKGRVYTTRLIFVDRNEQRLFVFPVIREGVNSTFHEWRRDNLAIPEHIFPFVAKVVRNDDCLR